MSFASDIGRMVARGPQRPMTDAESMTMLRIAFVAEEEPEQQMAMYRDLLAKSMSLKIIDARFRTCIGEDVKFSPTLLIWLSALADRRKAWLPAAPRMMVCHHGVPCRPYGLADGGVGLWACPAAAICFARCGVALVCCRVFA